MRYLYILLSVKRAWDPFTPLCEMRTNFCHFCTVKDMKEILQKKDVLP